MRFIKNGTDDRQNQHFRADIALWNEIKVIGQDYKVIQQIKEMQIEKEDVVVVGNNNQEEEGEFQHKTLNHNSLYYTFMERYFVNYENQYQYLHLHSNGICIIALKPSGLPSPPKSIKDFIQVSQVKGKKKKGGIRVRPQTVIARIQCQDGSELNVVALIEGTILEKNQRLNVEMLGRPEGYLIIILPQKKIVPEKFGMKKIQVKQ